jgi:hypothetical protein
VNALCNTLIILNTLRGSTNSDKISNKVINEITVVATVNYILTNHVFIHVHSPGMLANLFDNVENYECKTHGKCVLLFSTVYVPNNFHSVIIEKLRWRLEYA